MTFDLLSRRVLACLDEARTKKELLVRHSQLYPPTKFERVFSPKRQDEIEYEVSRRITSLIQSGYIKTEVISFTDHALYVPQVRYSLSSKGTQEVYAAKKK